eukprot:12460266-Alexandrium_andersonii.AAC.1
MWRVTDASMAGKCFGMGANCLDKASAMSLDTPGICLSCANGYGLIASSKANSWAIRFKATDGVECCWRTARAPKLSELTDTGVVRVNSVFQTRRLTNTARASQSVLKAGSPRRPWK